METYTHLKPVSSKQPAGTDDTTPSTLARSILQTFLAQRWHTLQDLVHPDAQLETGYSVPGTRFDAQRFVDSAWAAGTSGAYKPEFELVLTLDDHTALVVAKIRFEIGKDDFTERDAAYLMTFKDSLLWRNLVFDSVDEALTAYRAVRVDLPEAV